MRRSATLNPSRMPSRTTLEVFIAIASLRQRNYDLHGAELELRKALLIFPQEPIASANLAIVLADEGEQLRGRDATNKYNQAEALFRSAVTARSDSPAMHANFAAFLIRRGRLEEAERMLQVATILAPDNETLAANLRGVEELRAQAQPGRDGKERRVLTK